MEDSKEEERNDLQEKVESLESIVRMLELKAKNSQDHSKYAMVTMSAGVDGLMD